MKRIAMILTAAVLLFCCASCGQTETSGAAGAAKTVAAQPQTAVGWINLLLDNGVPFDDQMSMSDNAASVYGILDEDGYTGDCALYISAAATPEEIGVFRADSALSAVDLTDLAKARLARQKESYADYAPDEVPKLESAVVKTCGDFVIVCVSADNAKAETLLNPYA